MFRTVFMVLAILALGLFGTAEADNVSGLGSSVGADGVSTPAMTATTTHFAAVFRCTNPTSGGGGSMSATVTDCCVPGDIWRATITNKRSAAGISTDLIAHTANVGLTAGSAAFAPGVSSPAATISHDIGNQVIFTAGNSLPGGLPAGVSGTVTTPGTAGLVCVARGVVGGTIP